LRFGLGNFAIVQLRLDDAARPLLDGVLVFAHPFKRLHQLANGNSWRHGSYTVRRLLAASTQEEWQVYFQLPFQPGGNAWDVRPPTLSCSFFSART